MTRFDTVLAEVSPTVRRLFSCTAHTQDSSHAIRSGPGLPLRHGHLQPPLSRTDCEVSVVVSIKEPNAV